MTWMRMAKEMALMAALRAALAILALIGRELALSEDERRTVLGRVEMALLPPRHAS